MNIIEANLKRIYSLCKTYKVKSLSVFGSVMTDKFNDDSDIDFIVDFDTMPESHQWDYVTNFFEFREALERLFKRRVDLLEEKGLKNKYLAQNINSTKQLVYG